MRAENEKSVTSRSECRREHVGAASRFVRKKSICGALQPFRKAAPLSKSRVVVTLKADLAMWPMLERNLDGVTAMNSTSA